MRLASRSPLPGLPVSNSSDSPVGETTNVEAPPSTSIQVILRSPDWAAKGATAVSVNAAMAATERKRCIGVLAFGAGLTFREAPFCPPRLAQMQQTRARLGLGTLSSQRRFFDDHPQ